MDRKSGMSWMAAVCIGEKVTGCLQHCQRNERGMRIRLGKVPGIRGKAVHIPGRVREDGRMDGDNSICLPETCPLSLLRSV